MGWWGWGQHPVGVPQLQVLVPGLKTLLDIDIGEGLSVLYHLLLKSLRLLSI